MTKKALKNLFIIIIGLLVLTSCSRQIKVGFLMDDSQTGRWVKDKEMFINKVENLGGETIVMASEGDAEKQLELARELLKQKIDVLVLVPTDLYKAAQIVKLAHQYKIKVVSYDRLIRNCNLDFYISFDNVNVGELQASYISRACPEGNYAIIGGAVSDNNSFMLRLGQLNVLQPLVERGDIKIVYDQYVSVWTPDEGYRLMQECLKTTPKISAVVAASDQLAAGAIRALEEKGLAGSVCVSGQDANLDACRRIVSGTQTMTVYKPIEAITNKAAEIAIHMAKEDACPTTSSSVNNGKRLVPALLLPSMIVNRETIDLTVVADGYLEEHNIFD